MMAQGHPKPPDPLFLTFALHIENGVPQLVDHQPPPPRESVIPESMTMNAFVERVGKSPTTSAKRRRSAKASRRKQFPRGDEQSSSTHGPNKEDRQINIGRSFPEEAEKLDANHSLIPITVVLPTDSPETSGEPVPVANVPITGNSAMTASSTDLPNVLANAVPSSMGEQSPHHENHDPIRSVNTMNHSRTPPQQTDQGSSNGLVLGAIEAALSWSSSDAHAPQASSVHQPQGLSQPAESNAAASCNHFFEILSILQRCLSCGCGCGSMINVSNLAPTSQYPSSNLPLVTESADPYLTGPIAPTAGYHFASMLNGTASWNQNHDELFNFSSTLASQAPAGSMNNGQLMDLGTTHQTRPYGATGPPRLSTTDMMQHYRDQPSAISASASSPASSMLQPTPASATAQDLPSPLWNFNGFVHLHAD